jgi:high-affinity nickel-transport protein
MKINPNASLACAFLPGMLAPSIHTALFGAMMSEGLPHGLSPQKFGTFFFVAGLGLVLGMRHSTDADHVVAISTIVTRQRGLRGAALIGSLWGLGHTVTIFIVGCLIILGGIVIPPRIGLSMEFCVALMLILLGVLNLTGVMAKIVSRLTPARFAADQPLRPSPRLNPIARYGLYQCLRPLVVGLVHGLAGSAAIALLVLSTIHSPIWAVLYLVIFGVGTMLGMVCMTAALSLPMVYAGDRLPQVSHYLGVASGLVSVCFGAFLVYQLGYLGGLFTSHPHWTPQ